MKIADFTEERKLIKRGVRSIAGLDEVGRGPLAGPVVACALVFDFKHKNFADFSAQIQWRDSKLHTPKRRVEILARLRDFTGVSFAVAIVAPRQIDQLNILVASWLAMRRAVEKLKNQPEFLLIDGRYTLENYPCNQKALVRGDQSVASIAAASIVAKVLRDQMMEKYHRRWPQYGFDRHKGYGTRQHLLAIKKYGPCPIHRLSFAPFRHNLKSPRYSKRIT
ncbi:MAG: ribonuclease HII [Candidatus Portnoybacteria bacterium CG10_big_fil_rev_8_21_14_0_10_44_7]|uniref:Ribonuclease HII n=1 Tax=Candidatus Portnoybacteria bacterium CG10_big_fil_rev_8_21_14_0_10_44_7 TaxID=1974816 RepID=A0A2M8KI84_9BACT|nr:MAG: ribonuclease HII [Candidatus Portnoybacteria bacterium CG10_big_fil_rev_8_21_14_0_10_44_7]